MKNDQIEKLRDDFGVRDIADLMNMEDEDREKGLRISEKEMMHVAAVCNRYPNNELLVESSEGHPSQFSVRLDGSDESNFTLNVTLRRDIQEDDFENREEYLEELKVFKEPVKARFYPKSKEENWWIIAGHVSSGKLLSIKKI